jgi:hypothetical protein
LSSTNYELATRLGLQGYAEFEKEVSPLLARLDPQMQKQLLDKMYALAATKMLMEFAKTGFHEQETVFREQAGSVRQTRDHFRTAVSELLAAESSFHKNLPRWFDVRPMIAKLQELDHELEDNERLLDQLATHLTHPEGRRFPPGLMRPAP